MIIGEQAFCCGCHFVCDMIGGQNQLGETPLEWDEIRCIYE